jgi:hypothetical protein
VARAPEQSAPLICGLVGSAFCASLEEAERCIQLPAPVKQALSFLNINGKRSFVQPPRHWNFAYRMRQQETKKKNKADEEEEGQKQPQPPPLCFNADKLTMSLVDAGVHVNAPLIPLFRPERRMDAVFVFDARPTESKDAKVRAHEARNVLAAFVAHSDVTGLKIPASMRDAKRMRNVGVRACTVFEAAARVPSVVYLPLVRNDAYDAKFDPATASHCDVTRFSYSGERFDQLAGLSEFNAKASVPKIRALLAKLSADKLNRKKKKQMTTTASTK